MLAIFIIINYHNIPADEINIPADETTMEINFNSRDRSFDVWIDILFNLWDRKVAIKFPEYEDRRFCRDSFAIFDLRISCTVSFSRPELLLQQCLIMTPDIRSTYRSMFVHL